MWTILPQNLKEIIVYMGGYIVNTFLGALWKKPQWVAQVHVEHILLQIVKETSGYIQNVPSGHLAGHIVKVITMCPLITLRSKWWAHCESNLDEWLRFHAGHIVSHILKETHGFFHKVPLGHLAEHIVKELNMYLPVTCWLNCLKNHNVIVRNLLLLTI